MSDAVMNVLAMFGVGVIFLICVIVGGMFVVHCIKKVFNFLFK